MHTLPERFEDISLAALPPEEKPALLAALANGAPARGLRLRPGVSLEMIRARLPGAYEAIPWAKDAYYLDADSAAGAHALHAAGAYYLQEPSAMAAVGALDVRPGQRVLDLCAAPGGKSTQIAALLDGSGTLVSNEYVAQRAKILSHNLERLGARNAIVTNEAPDRLAGRWGAWFDRILVDAPCSGEGMFRREPESRAQWTPQSPAGCATRQAAILDAAAAMLLPGGLLVYSTCTFNTQENEDTVAAFLASHPDFSPEPFSLDGVGDARDGCLRLWPHRLRGEGHFVARLRKTGATASRPADGSQTALAEVFEAFGRASAPGIIARQGDRHWLLPPDMPDLTGIHVLRSGLALGETRGKIFVPDHAAAMAFAPAALAQAAAVSDEDALRYLRGETIQADACANGWTAIAYEGLGLGWGKCVDGTIKNHLPKGLRRMR